MSCRIHFIFVCWLLLAVATVALAVPGNAQPESERSKESGAAEPAGEWVRIVSSSAKLLQAPSYHSRVVREAERNEKFLVVQRVKSFFLLRDEETESFLFVDQYAVEFTDHKAPNEGGSYLRDEVMQLGFARAPSPEWGRSVRASSRGDLPYDGWSHGKRYPTSYSTNFDYAPGLDAGRFIREAQQFLGMRYSLGGNGSASIDCSALTKLAAAAQGVELPRRASLQASVGRMVGRDDLRAGDLLFFRDHSDPGFLSHVAIYVGGGRILHAAKSLGRVGYSSLSESYYASHFAFGRRL